MLLDRPALLELRLSRPLDLDSAWLSTIVGIRTGTVEEYPAGRVDLGTGIVASEVQHLATFLAVTPPSSALFPVTSGSGPSFSVAPADAAFVGVAVDSVKVGCGAPANRCEGVTASATQNLLDQVDRAALLYPELTGALRIGATAVTGSITASATLRVLLKSGQTAESVEVNALLEPTAQTVAVQTATDIRLTNMRHRVSGSADGSTQAVDEIATLTIPRSGPSGRVSVRRSFGIKVAGGGTETATVSFTFPVRVFE